MNLPRNCAQQSNRPPVSIENIVEKVWEDWGIGEEESRESIISGNWQKVVGKSLSLKCAPVNLSRDGKTLHIRAASSTIKQEITFRKTEILKKIKSLKECSAVNNIRVY